MTESEEIQRHYEQMFKPYLAGLVKLVAGLVANDDRTGLLILGKTVDTLFQAGVERLPDQPIDMAAIN